MRIAIATHSVVRADGQGRVAYEIARESLRQGHSVTLLADRVDTDIEGLGARWVPVHPAFQTPMLFKILTFTHAVNRALDRMRGDFDIVQGFGFVTTRPHEVSGSQFVHSAWRRSPLHFARGRSDLWARYQWLYSTLNARWEMRAYAQAKRIVACSRCVRQELVDSGVAADKIEVIWNAVDIGEFHPGAGDRDALGLPQGVPLALFVGDIRTKRKGLDTVLTALVDCPNVHLVVVGETRESPFPSMARRLGVADRVRFLGFRRNVALILTACDMYVFPSRYEPFGIVVLEAMATGTPVITARTVGASEIVADDAGIVIADPDDAAALSAAMSSLAEDSERRKCMGLAARAIAENHTWSRMGDAYLKLYSGIALL